MIAQTRLTYIVSCCGDNENIVVVVKVLVEGIFSVSETSAAKGHADDVCAIIFTRCDGGHNTRSRSRPIILQSLSDEEGELGGVRVHRGDALSIASDGTDGAGAVSAVAITVDVPGSRVSTWNVSIDAVGCIRQIFMAKSVTSIDDANLLRSGGVGRKKG